MNESTLVRIAATFLRENYNETLHIPVKRNNRLRSSYGRFILKNNKAYCIDLAGRLLDYGAEEVIINILKHECIHYALFMKQQPYRDGSPVFEAELKKHGAPETRKLIVGKFYVLKCDACGNTTKTNRKRTIAHPEQYQTACCRAPFQIIGEQIYNGTNNH